MGTKPLDQRLNFYKILSNYLLSKTADDFTSNKGGLYDSSDLNLLTALINGFKNFNYDMSSSIRFKTYMAYLMCILSRYFKLNDETCLHEIAQTLFNRNADRVVPIDFLTQLRHLLIKRVIYLNENESDFFQKLKDQINEIIEQEYYNLSQDQIPDEVYSNELFYQDLNDLIKKHLDHRNISLIFEISKTYDLNQDQDEEMDLINYFVSIKKRKFIKEENEEPDLKSINLNKSKESTTTSFIHISCNNKKQKMSQNEVDDSENEFNVNLNYHEPEQTELGPSPVISLIGLNQQELAFDEPTQSKLEKTKIPEKINKNEKKSPTKIQKETKKSPRKKFTSGEILLLEEELGVDLSDLSDKSSELDFSQSPIRKDKKNQKKSTSSPNQKCSKSKEDKNDSDSDMFHAVKLNASKSKNRIVESDNEEKKDEDSDEIPKIVSKNQKKSREEAEISLDSIESDDQDKKHWVKSNRTTTSKRKWTDTETVYLVAGVEMFGRGNWSKILKNFESKFNKRTSVHLKDKYRNLQKNNDLAKYEKLAKILKDKKLSDE